jgi:type IV secretion system protein VirD4
MPSEGKKMIPKRIDRKDKSDNYRALALYAADAKIGQKQGESDGTSAAFNPLAEVRLDTAMSIPDVQQIALMVMDPNGKGLEDYWGKAAFCFLGGALLHCLIKSNTNRAARPVFMTWR